MDAWILSWMPGQGTGFHDHYISGVGLCVARGCVREDIMVYGGEPQSRRLGDGATRQGGPGYIHRVNHDEGTARRDGSRLLPAARLGRPVPARRGRRRSARGAARPQRAHRAAHRRRRPRARPRTILSGTAATTDPQDELFAVLDANGVPTGAEQAARRHPPRRRLARRAPHLGRRHRRRRSAVRALPAPLRLEGQLARRARCRGRRASAGRREPGRDGSRGRGGDRARAHARRPDPARTTVRAQRAWSRQRGPGGLRAPLGSAVGSLPAAPRRGRGCRLDRIRRRDRVVRRLRSAAVPALELRRDAGSSGAATPLEVARERFRRR